MAKPDTRPVPAHPAQSRRSPASFRPEKSWQGYQLARLLRAIGAGSVGDVAQACGGRVTEQLCVEPPQ